MDWAKAIAINQAALSRIVAGLIAMVGLTAREAVERLPRPVYRAALGVLRPVEAAHRRLIVIAAKDVVVKPEAVRPLPAGLRLPAGSGGAGVSFQLFDPRKRFAAIGPRRPGPRIRGFGAGPLVPLLRPRVKDKAKPEPDDGTVDARRLGHRLWAVKRALDTLPRQAMRLKRWQARRARMANPKFTSPLRPGLPPGHRKEPRDEVDRVLRECHALARAALDSS
jgi:hypothetical protein